MAKFKVQAPDGTVLIIEGPEDATEEELTAAGSQQWKPATGAARARGVTEPSIGDIFKRELMNSVPGGLMRGAKDVVDTGASWLAGLFSPEEKARVDAMNAKGKQDFADVTDGSLTTGIARIGGNILATMPATAGLGAAAGAAGLTKLGHAIGSGGVATGAPAATTALAKVGDMATRVFGGGIAGGVSAGLVDPQSATEGAAIGAALPPAMKAAGTVAGGAGRLLFGAPGARAAVQSAASEPAKHALAAGYVIPPTQVNPTLRNRLLEGYAGKLTTAQQASAKNQEVTNRLAKEALGVSPGNDLSLDLLADIRSKAGAAYKEISDVGSMRSDRPFKQALASLKGHYEGAAKSFPGLARPDVTNTLDALNEEVFTGKSAVDAIKLLREGADDAFAQGRKGFAKAQRGAANALEDVIERNLSRMSADKALSDFIRAGGLGGDNVPGAILEAAVGNKAPQTLKAFRDARQLIAKTYTVQKALNPETGNVSAQVLAKDLARGKPLSGELKTAARVGAAFPKAVQSPEKMGSLPGVSPLDFGYAGGLGALAGIATGNPLGAAAGLAHLVARPTARNIALGPTVQKSLSAAPPSGGLSQALTAAERASQPLLYRGAPLLSSDR